MMALEDRLLALVRDPGYEPLDLKGIASRLELTGEEVKELRGLVKELIAAGRLERTREKALRKPGVAGAVVGTFRRTARGHGFVRPHPADGKRALDIYVPASAALDASTGDEVAVQLARKGQRRGEGPAGRVMRVLSRARGQFVGSYFERGGGAYVQVDGTTFHDPIWVGDPGARGARAGDKVVLEMVRYPTPDQQGEGVITEVLGPRGQPGVDTLSVIRAFNLPDAFDEAVLEEARAQAQAFDEKDVHGRLDLREKLTVTIDPASAHDFDDAITLERDAEGYWHLGVHIADVAHFVRAGSALDRSARQRGTSVYLPGRVLPMLPEVISNSLASLQQDKTRYTVSVLMEFNPEGIRTHAQFARTVIRVDRRLSYEQAYEAMMHPNKPIAGLTVEVRALLERMLELAMLLRGRRRAQGSLELSMPEVEIELDGEGRVSGAKLAEDDESHQTIEEFMLAANEGVAEHLAEKGIAMLHRVHPAPEPQKLEQFAEFAESLGYPIEDPQSRFELQRVLAASAHAPERHAVHFGLLRSLKQAVYTPELEEHYALAIKHYCHFTSPIRRYPDLQVHRQLIAVLNRHRPKAHLDELAVLGEHCTKTERRAEAAERDLIKLKLLMHLVDQIGARYDAVVIGVEEFGLFCQLLKLPVEGFIHVTSLADDLYDHEAGTHTIVGRRGGRRYRLGDRVDVRIARVDIDRRELDLVLSADHPDELPPPRSRGRGRGAGGGGAGRSGRARREFLGAGPVQGEKRPKGGGKKGGRRGRKNR